ncbi:MAG: ABC transporter ATP-binding protein [Coprothermobacterota bacterium]|nr:ABC transporter ATP-binding protein [Coprothermobacterota bacterium]
MFKHFRRMLSIYKGAGWHFALSQLLVALAITATLLIQTLNGQLVNQGVQAGNVDVVINTSLWMIGLAIIGAFFSIGNAVYAVIFSEETGNYLRVKTYRKAQSLSFGNIDRFRTSDLLVRLTDDITNIRTAVLYGMIIILQAPLAILITFILTWVMAPSLIWIMGVVMVVVVIVMGFLLNGVQKMFSDRQQRLDQVNSVLQENLAGVRVVKAFVREKHESRRFAAAAEELRKTSLAPAIRIAMVNPATNIIVYLATAAVLYFGGSGVMVSQTLSLGQVVVFAQYLLYIIVPMVMLAYLLPYLESGETSAGRIFQVLDAEPEVQDKPGVEPIDWERLKGGVVFEHASFGYRSEDGQMESAMVLKDINLEVEPGQTIGFLGATGSGKSTLVHLVPRFYDVVEGRVLIDGINVRDFPQSQLRQMVSLALQEAVLFSGTVRANLLVGRPEASEEEMMEASAAADAHGFITAIPERYDARVTRRGNNFSGGQRQRLSIARALVPKPRILILDDSTSAVDVGAEARIQKALRGLLGKTTTFFVAQRISTVLTADQIVLLENGRQVAVGNHTQLIATSPLYREIFESQLGKLEDLPSSVGGSRQELKAEGGPA